MRQWESEISHCSYPSGVFLYLAYFLNYTQNIRIKQYALLKALCEEWLDSYKFKSFFFFSIASHLLYIADKIKAEIKRGKKQTLKQNYNSRRSHRMFWLKHIILLGWNCELKKIVKLQKNFSADAKILGFK